MNNASLDFIEFLSSIEYQKIEFAKLIGSDPARAFVYYIAPLSNVVRIYQSGGILPRNKAKGYVDLSGHSIQKYRDRFIELNGTGKKLEVPLHDCVNFFLNPFNHTYYQFRRHALIRAQAGDPWSQWVCILELDLNRILDNNTQWAVTNKNFATNDAMAVSRKADYSNFPWKRIYSLEKSRSKDKFNDFRSAEFIVYPGNPQGNPIISTSCIERVLIAEQDMRFEPRVTYSELPFDLIAFTGPMKLQVLENPLYNDFRWVTSLDRLQSCGISKQSIVRSFQRILNVEYEIGRSLISSFTNPRVANGGLHGTAHIVRVMFWILMLSEAAKNSGISISESEITAALYAGFFHDLCRKSNYEEPDHGKAAAKHFRNTLSNILPAETLERSIKAITVHSAASDPDDDDIVWKLVKDADALDRGRFAAPGNPSGCDGNRLRMPFFKTNSNLLRNCLWSAYWLPRVTAYINWKENACQDFVLTLLSSLNAVINYENLPSSTSSMARNILLEMVHPPLRLYSS